MKEPERTTPYDTVAQESEKKIHEFSTSALGYILFNLDRLPHASIEFSENGTREVSYRNTNEISINVLEYYVGAIDRLPVGKVNLTDYLFITGKLSSGYVIIDSFTPVEQTIHGNTEHQNAKRAILKDLMNRIYDHSYSDIEKKE